MSDHEELTNPLTNPPTLEAIERTNPGVGAPSATEAAMYLAQLRALELYRAELRREESRITRNKAVTAILKGKWGGPIVLLAGALLALVIVGLFAMAGVDVSGLVIALSTAAAHAWTGCPTSQP